jgi:hypothetical protein
MARTLVSTITPVAENKVAQVGDIVHSMLTEAQFQAERDGTWVLADGRSVVGDGYETITGNTNIPDLRGRFLRGKNNGRVSGSNPDGEFNLGQEQGDAFQGHEHKTLEGKIGGSGTSQMLTITNVGNVSSYSNAAIPLSTNQTVDGGQGTPRESTETRSANTTVNYFIKIN